LSTQTANPASKAMCFQASYFWSYSTRRQSAESSICDSRNVPCHPNGARVPELITAKIEGMYVSRGLRLSVGRAIIVVCPRLALPENFKLGKGFLAVRKKRFSKA